VQKEWFPNHLLEASTRQTYGYLLDRYIPCRQSPYTTAISDMIPYKHGRPNPPRRRSSIYFFRGK
jgi:hypothetical protein